LDIAGQLVLSKKAENVKAIDVRNVSNVTDYFLICSADTDIQVKAIADAVRKGTPHKPWKTEGYEHRYWVLLDYIDVVIHIFRTTERDYYSLDKLWADAPTWTLTDEPESPSI
jgi:ribosome-associated protein